jgi:hypothetical protein
MLPDRREVSHARNAYGGLGVHRRGLQGNARMSAFILRADNARDRMAAAWRAACDLLQHGRAAKVTVEECQPTRTLEQNAKLWAVLTDIAQQVPWHVDGKLQHIEAADWKDILTAGLKKTQRIAAGIEGGFVMLGQRTSKMKVGEMVELIEFALWFGTERGVKWGREEREAA